MDKVIEYIKCNSNPERPISGKNIADFFGITGADVRRHISNARSNGAPICSTRKGYYYSESKEDIYKTIESLIRRVASQEKAIIGMKSLI